MVVVQFGDKLQVSKTKVQASMPVEKMFSTANVKVRPFSGVAMNFF